MPTYEFENRKTGTRVERFFSVDEAPSIGSFIVIGGKQYHRRPSTSQALVQPDCYHVSKMLHENHPHAPRVNSQGEAVFTTRKEIREFEAKTGMKYD